MQNELTILFFGQLAEVTGTASVQLPREADTEQLDQRLQEKFPRLKEFVFIKAINNKVVNGRADIPEGATIAYLPPFSGG